MLPLGPSGQPLTHRYGISLQSALQRDRASGLQLGEEEASETLVHLS